MPKRAKSILIIPPKGGRIRFLRIRVRVVILLLIFFLAGFAGLFIPFSNFTLDVVEQNQKKNLADQNQKLLHRIHSMRTLLHGLDNKLDQLRGQREQVDAIVGISPPEDSAEEFEELGPLSTKALDRILEYVETTEEFYRRFARKVQANPSLFNRLPVIEPVVDGAVIIAGFGDMRDPFTGIIKRHYGIDYAAPRETPVIATAEGTVTQVENHRQWGWRVRIRHGFGFTTVYAHLGTVKVSQGRRVNRGDVIATIGMSGLATGPHLHYEMWLNGTAVNPRHYVFPSLDVAVAGGTGGKS